MLKHRCALVRQLKLYEGSRLIFDKGCRNFIMYKVFVFYSVERQYYVNYVADIVDLREEYRIIE
ncbi:hypothetical protein DERP_006289 [Dermatophagoides pteronyssinus]|uniref:Uncharacterized protein n=1 Tax=Dermatophagoides pteronyssinus TaxID=6956 RepID=A0ABQ8IY16_DERPT|nr:hypothetical protein DERP_006289 [Dermatophagoides pteronyssinus]